MMWEIFGEVFFGDSQRLVDVEHNPHCSLMGAK